MLYKCDWSTKYVLQCCAALLYVTNTRTTKRLVVHVTSSYPVTISTLILLIDSDQRDLPLKNYTDTNWKPTPNHHLVIIKSSNPSLQLHPVSVVAPPSNGPQ